MSAAPDDDTRRTARPASVEDPRRLLASLDSLTPHVVSIDLEGVEIRTLDLEGLSKTKQTQRAKDQIDRLVLERAVEALKDKPAKG